MSVIAALVAMPPLRAAGGAALTMLNEIEAPGHPRRDGWQDGAAALGVRSASGVSGLHEDDKLVVVADSRLDSRRELCAELDLSETRTSDARLIAAAYGAWGDACAERLKGDFAFIIWNKRTSSLFCARDRFGLKALYYRKTASGVRLATAMRALAVEQGLSGLAVDENWVVDFAAGFVTDTESSPYAEIRRLPPAHRLQWKNGQLSIARYWSLDDVCMGAEENDIDALRAAFIDAVERRMPEPNPAAFLSGGLDSSSICCVARDLLRNREKPPLTTISMVFDETPEACERSYIETVLATGHFAPQLVNITNYRPLQELDRLVGLQDAPFLARGLPLSDRLYSVVEGAGIGAILDGHGGDEVISSGLGRLHELARAGDWATLLAEFAALGFHKQTNMLPAYASYVGRYARGAFARVGRGVASRTRPRESSTTPLDWLASHWRDDTRADERQGQRQRAEAGFFQNDRQHHAWQIVGPLQPYGFEVLGCLSRSHGLDVRFPFWDQGLVELCLRFPSSYKLSKGMPRALIRSAMKGVIPDRTRKRSDKLDFTSHLVGGYVRDKSLLLDMAASPNSGLDQFVNRAAFAEAIGDLSNPDESTRGEAASRVWLGASLASWLSSRQASTSRVKAPLECQD